MAKKLIVIAPGGQVTGINSDILETSGLGGSKVVKRASSIEPSDDGQWDVHIFETGEKFKAPTHKLAVDREIEIINELLRKKAESGQLAVEV